MNRSSEAASIRAIEAKDWPLLRGLFGDRGGCGGCWCMAWRLTAREWEEGRGSANEAALRSLVEAGRARGAIALEGGVAVGWCSVGPRSDFTRLAGMRSLRTDWDEHTWSVTCFFLDKKHRGQGLGTRLLEAAVEIARSSGARALEGYPAVPYDAMKRLPGAFAWTGLPGMFERAGFERIPAEGKRPVFRLVFRRATERRKHP